MSGAAAGDSALKAVQNGGKALPVNFTPAAVPGFDQVLANGAPVNLQGGPVNLQGASIASQLARPAQPAYTGMKGGFQDLFTPYINQHLAGLGNTKQAGMVDNIYYSNHNFNQAAYNSWQASNFGTNTGRYAQNGMWVGTPSGHWEGNNWVVDKMPSRGFTGNQGR